DVDEWTGELVTAFHAPEAWRHPLPLADARRVAVRTAPERLRARGGLDLLDDRDAEQSFLVPQGDRVTDAEVAVVRDVTVPGVVRIVLVVVPGVATVPTVVARCHEEPGALWKLPRHVPSLARAQDEENEGVLARVSDTLGRGRRLRSLDQERDRDGDDSEPAAPEEGVVDAGRLGRHRPEAVRGAGGRAGAHDGDEQRGPRASGELLQRVHDRAAV